MKIDTSHCTRKCSATLSKKTAEAFPARLLEIHEGRIVLRDTAVWTGNKNPIDVKCTVCNKEWKSSPDNLKNSKGCPDCANIRRRNSAGRRCRWTTEAEREFMNRCKIAGLNNTQIGKMLGRTEAVVAYWVSQKRREVMLDHASKRQERDTASGKAAERTRNYRATEHGNQAHRKSNQKRRSLKYNCSGSELIDGVWQENDLWSYVDGDRKAYEVMSFEGADEAIAFRTKQCKEFERWSGEEYQIDHIIPLSKGGAHHPLNFQNLPAAVNVSKKNTIRDKDVSLFCKRLFNL